MAIMVGPTSAVLFGHVALGDLRASLSLILCDLPQNTSELLSQARTEPGH